ncbi:MAG: ABC transporter permease, partial [Alphaproteobacteria bacterium]|nr:ABC transporter permease [Alphaproteobacteria bacterium]
VLHHATIMVAAIAAGALWLAPVAFLKAKRHVHEVVSTVMLNFVALYLLSFLISWPLRDRSADMGAFAHRLAPSARFPVIESPLTIAVAVAVIGAIVMYVLVKHTRLGMRIRAVGFNLDAAQMAGIPAARMNTLVFAIGGGAAGLAGCVLVAGLAPQWTISDDLSAVRNFGILGIAVAMIARHNPLGCLAAAFFVAAIRTSRYQFQKYGVTAEVTDVFIGAIIFAFAFPRIAALIGRHLASRRHARVVS